MALVAVVMALVLLMMILVFAGVTLMLFAPWMRGFLSGAPVSILQLLGMRLRGVPARLIVDAVITLVHRGHAHDRKLVSLAESTYLAQRGLIQDSTQLADMVEKQLQIAKPAI
jgi:uncharacterized protein YqfA (UPF0365 family)